jgi:hypothetical protein
LAISSLSCEPVAIALVLILPAPNFLIAAVAPSMRGWMLS